MRRRALILGAAMLFAVSAVPSAARAGAWTTEEGVVWGKIALFHLDSDRVFVGHTRDGTDCSGKDGTRTLNIGDRAPYDCMLGGGLKTTQLFVEASFGLHERVELGLQLPIILNGEFVSDDVTDNSRGLGDLRFGTKVLIVPEPLVLSAAMDVKAPTGDFSIDAVQVPLGEGQWDVTFRGLVAKSFLEGKLWAGGEAGYRIRTDNEETQPQPIDMGDEVVAVLEGGARPLPWLYLPARLELLWGFDSHFEPANEFLPRSKRGRRRVLFVQTGLMLNPLRHTAGYFRDLGVEWGVRVPVWGEDWPADPVWFVGFTNRFRVFEPYSTGDG